MLIDSFNLPERETRCGTFGSVPSFLTRGVMVIVAGYGHGDTSSNPGPD